MKDLTFRQKMIQGIHDLFYIWKREFGTTFRDQGVLIFFVLVPLVYPLIYAFIYTNETIHEVPTVVVDDSRSSLSREYLRKVDSSPEVSLVSYCADMEEAKLMLKDRRAYGIIYIPSSFSDDIVRGKQTQVSIFCDMSGLLYYKALLTANTNVSLAMNADIKVERSANTTDRQDKITAYPIEYEVQVRLLLLQRVMITLQHSLWMIISADVILLLPQLVALYYLWLSDRMYLQSSWLVQQK